jgi:uncharacterized damage-inducible protein DinB
VPDVPALLQPAAHALLMAREDVDRALSGISEAQLWERPGGIASLGYHLGHLAGSTDRLMTHARGEPLTDAQKAALVREQSIAQVRPALRDLLDDWHRVLDAARRQLASTRAASLLEARYVGRARLPSTVLGLLFHAAEHASRHTGQIVTTAKLLRGTA